MAHDRPFDPFAPPGPRLPVRRLADAGLDEDRIDNLARRFENMQVDDARRFANDLRTTSVGNLREDFAIPEGDVEAVADLPKPRLINLAASLDLPVSGNRADLAARIVEARDAAPVDPPAKNPAEGTGQEDGQGPAQDAQDGPTAPAEGTGTPDAGTDAPTGAQDGQEAPGVDGATPPVGDGDAGAPAPAQDAPADPPAETPADAASPVPDVPPTEVQVSPGPAEGTDEAMTNTPGDTPTTTGQADTTVVGDQPTAIVGDGSPEVAAVATPPADTPVGGGTTAADNDPSLSGDAADVNGTATTDEPVEGEASTGPTPRAARARKGS